MKQELVKYCRWSQKSVFNRLLDPELTFYLTSHYSFQVVMQTAKLADIWRRKICAVHEVPLHDIEIGVWCAVNVQRIIGLAFFS